MAIKIEKEIKQKLQIARLQLALPYHSYMPY